MERLVVDIAAQTVTRVPLTAAELAEREKTALESAWQNLRDERDRLLASSDWTVLPDSPADSKAWTAYRKKLRDLPSKTKDPAEVVWPPPPQ